jgi:hypothetical protein
MKVEVKKVCEYDSLVSKLQKLKKENHNDYTLGAKVRTLIESIGGSIELEEK